jgi:membrane protein
LRRRKSDVTTPQSGPELPSLRQLTRQSWSHVVRRALRGFTTDSCTDQAAALTYYSVLSLFPAMIALLSLIGLVGDGPRTVRTLLDVLRQVGADSAAKTVEPTLVSLAEGRQAAGFALVLGLGAAVWSASGYVGAFGRAMNRIYGFEEGRPFWKLRIHQIIVTVVVLVLAAVLALTVTLSGSFAAAIGEALGIGSTGLMAWRIAKWPVMLLAVVFVVGVLYFATPNIKRPKFRVVSVGAALAIVGWVLASMAFALYVANFSSYNKVYGALAGVIVLLVWMWLTNLSLLFGAEVDAEVERGRQLQAGLPAETDLQLDPRDEAAIEASRRKDAEDARRAERLRKESGAGG